jgi:hypothetical protein
VEGSVRGIIPTLSTFPVGGNRRNPTTFGRALTDSFHISGMHESVVRIEPTISEVKGACSDDCDSDLFF